MLVYPLSRPATSLPTELSHSCRGELLHMRRIALEKCRRVVIREQALVLSQPVAAEERNCKSWPAIPAILRAASSGVKIPTSLPLPSAATTGMMSISL